MTVDLTSAAPEQMAAANPPDDQHLAKWTIGRPLAPEAMSVAIQVYACLVAYSKDSADLKRCAQKAITAGRVFADTVIEDQGIGSITMEIKGWAMVPDSNSSAMALDPTSPEQAAPESDDVSKRGGEGE